MLTTARALVLALVSVALLGCGGSDKSAPLQTSGLKPLAIFYGRFLAQHRGMPPKDEAEFKAFLQTLPAEEWKTFNFESMDQAWNGGRDKQPYVIIYGAPGPALNGAPIIGYEKQGVSGKRYIANWNGDVQEVDEAKFKELIPNAS